MSDSGIEQAYEEDLKAARGRLRLYVDGIPEQSEDDTPAGRARLEKVAFRASETSDDVRVERVSGSSVVPGGLRELGSPSVNRPTLVGKSVPRDPAKRALTHSSGPCEPFARRCVPEIYVGPSGKRMRHRWDCPDKPGQPISVKEYARGRQWPPVPRRVG